MTVRFGLIVSTESMTINRQKHYMIFRLFEKVLISVRVSRLAPATTVLFLSAAL